MSKVIERLSHAVGDRYRIVRGIGAGAMGSVFLADDLKLHRSVAIKVLHPELAASMKEKRFHREIRIAAGLAHPHIVPVHDSGASDGLLYYVMRHQEGESLRELLDREGALPIPRAVSIARDVAEGLAHAHAKGVIHRDIKPANILLTGDHALITDFGIARAVEAATGDGADVATTSAALGTPLYISPEQALGSPEIDGRSDIYSLGCVMYEMLTGKPPFMGRTAPAVVAGHLRETADPVRQSRSDVPQLLGETVHRALKKSPDERFETADDLRRTLESAQGGLETIRVSLATRWRWLSHRGRRLVSTTVGLSLIVVAAVLTWTLWPRGGPALDPSSMVVLPFRGAITTPEEEHLIVALADELTRQLNRWDSVSAIPQISQTGVRFDLGIEGPLLARLDEGLAVARALRAGTLVNLTATFRGDSVIASAEVINSQNGRVSGKPYEVVGELSQPVSVAAAAAHLILGLEGSTSEIARLRQHSEIPEALIEWESGRRALEEWRLADAISFFQSATELDPGFAMAHHLVALTLFWEWVEGIRDQEEVGPQISLRSTLAFRNSSGLSAGDSLHIIAFNRFQAGDYERARLHCGTLLERDSADVYAWLLQGSVESFDPWLMELPSGDLQPRSNLNLARHSFDETVRLAPSLQGAYGQVLDIAEKVADAAEQRRAPVFEMPRGEFIAPWAPRTPHQTRVFWPVYLDSLMWVDPATWIALDESLAASGANRLLEESLVGLRRWSAFEPDQARPQRELAEWTLALRSRISGPDRPSFADSLAGQALQYLSRALALSADTTRDDLFRLANLQLATGDIPGARSAWEFAAEWEGTDATGSPTLAASNILLYSGRPGQTLDYLSAETPHRFYYRDADTGELIDDRGAEPLIQRLLILGATGVRGPALESGFRELTELWTAETDRLRRETHFLKTVTAPRVAVALWLAPDVLGSWAQELDLKDPLWAALRPDVRARDTLLSAALGTEMQEIKDPNRSFLLGAVAQEVGDGVLSARLFSRLDSLVYRVHSRDVGWGLLALSYFYRGRAYEAIDDFERAAEFYGRFLEVWPDPDLPTQLTDEARHRLEELSQ